MESRGTLCIKKTPLVQVIQKPRSFFHVWNTISLFYAAERSARLTLLVSVKATGWIHASPLRRRALSEVVRCTRAARTDEPPLQALCCSLTPKRQQAHGKLSSALLPADTAGFECSSRKPWCGFTCLHVANQSNTWFLFRFFFSLVWNQFGFEVQ